MIACIIRSPSPSPMSPTPQSPTSVSSLLTDILSPDSDGDRSQTGSHDSSTREGFYLLRKDSERRQTLVHLLTQESDIVCVSMKVSVEKGSYFHTFCDPLIFSPLGKNFVVWDRSGSVAECLTRDQRAAGSSLTGVTALCP